MESKFTGRIKELNLLANCLEKANNGLGNLVLIEGNSGSGKTALIQHFVSSKRQTERFIVCDTECCDKENLNAYSPIKDIFIKLNTNNIEKSKKKENREKLKSFFSEAGPKWISLIPIVGSYASVGIEIIQTYKKTFKDQPINKIESQNEVHQIFETEIRRISEKKTLIIFIDDIQWADAATLNFLFALGKNIRIKPFKILLIASFRPDEIKIGRKKSNEFGQVIDIRHPFADTLNELRNYTKIESHVSENQEWLCEIEMADFSKDESEKIVNNKFDPNNFDPAFFTRIFNLTNGNPLFLTEMLTSLAQNGNIVKKENTYQLQNIDIEQLPVSVNGVIAERVDRLDDQLKKILSYASVSGEKFIIQEIENILKIDEFDLLDYLETLNQKYDLLSEEDGLAFNDLLLDMYSFSQNLVHQFIYNNIDNTKKRRLHKHIAETIKSIWGDKLNQYTEIYKKYNTHLQIAQGLIDGKTRLIENIEPLQEHAEITENLLKAAEAEIKQAEENAKIWADNETIIHAEKALAFLSKLKQKDKETEKLRYEAYYNKWQALYSKTKQEAYKIVDILAEITDFFNDDDTKLSKSLRTRTAMCYTLHFSYKKAENYFFENSVTDNYLSIEEENKIEEYTESQYFDKAYEIYLVSQVNDNNIADEEILLSLGTAALNHSSGLFLEKADEFLTKAYMIFDDDCDHLMTTIASYHTGIVKYKLGKFKEAKFYLDKARIRYERWNWGIDYIDKLLAEINKTIKNPNL